MTEIRFDSLAQARARLKELQGMGSLRSSGPWSLYKTWEHCRQSIGFSIDGFPTAKPAVLRKTIGKLVARGFLRRGFMKHALNAPIPGAPDIDDDGDAEAALQALLDEIDRFAGHDGELAAHFVFDRLTKDQYDRLHAMHVADHLSAIGPS